ncbi:MAG: hypothetical protein ACE5OY_02155 [Candidatus Bathyarchaeia archaeon]
MKLTEFEIKKVLRWFAQNEEVTSREVTTYVSKKFEKQLTWYDLKLLFMNCTGNMDIRYSPSTDSWRFADKKTRKLEITPVDP